MSTTTGPRSRVHDHRPTNLSLDNGPDNPPYREVSGGR